MSPSRLLSDDVHAKKSVIGLLCLSLVAACAKTPVRSEITTNSGIPLSVGLKLYDVEHYTLRNDIQIEKKSIAGSAAVRFKATQELAVLELDFDGLFRIDRIEDDGGVLDYARDEAKLYVTLRNTMQPGETHEVTVHYHGRPLEVKRAPWDGGF